MKTFLKKKLKILIKKIELITENYKLKRIETIIEQLHQKKGLEIGGRSPIFESKIPIYQKASIIDGVNFSPSTIWEGTINEGLSYNYYDKKIGLQHIAEASELININNDIYDFTISSHCIEHCANPIKTLLEWKRVTKKKGLIITIVPDKNYTFDRMRNYSTFKHLMEDYCNNVGENDMTHLEEIIEKHDLSIDINAGDKEAFRRRCLNNYTNRAMHHHVFSVNLLKKIYIYCKLNILLIARIKPYHIIIIGQKK